MKIQGAIGRGLAMALAPLVLVGCAKETAPPTSPGTTTPPPATSKLGTSSLNVTYCAPGGVAQLLDIYYPLQSATSLFPVIVYIHGGQLIMGNKGTAAPGTPAGEWRTAATPRGYAVVSINYRLGPTFKFPAMIEDANCAIRYLRANAATLSINPDRIGVTGTSSGGYLAALVALTDSSAGFADNGGYPGVSSRVHAAVVEYGADMDPQQPPYSNAEQVGRQGAFLVPVMPSATVINHVTPGDPPFFFIHGARDSLVDPQDNRDIDARLRSVGVPSSFQLVTNGVHGWDSEPAGPISPSWAQILQMELAFFDTYLK